jgi:hypothetical protein
VLNARRNEDQGAGADKSRLIPKNSLHFTFFDEDRFIDCMGVQWDRIANCEALEEEAECPDVPPVGTNGVYRQSPLRIRPVIVRIVRRNHWPELEATRD